MKTKKKYEYYLNEIGYSLNSEDFIIGGKQRNIFAGYGFLIRKYDPIAFEVGFNGWRANK